MREYCKLKLKKEFRVSLIKSREAADVSQAAMAGQLQMAPRSYSDLECGKSCCGAVTLALYLIYVCPDPMKFLTELRRDIEEGEQQL